MGHTALHKVGEYFAGCGKFFCSLATVVLPDTVTEVGRGFLDECGPVEVISGSTAVQAAVAEHNANGFWNYESETGNTDSADDVSEEFDSDDESSVESELVIPSSFCPYLRLL